MSTVHCPLPSCNEAQNFFGKGDDDTARQREKTIGALAWVMAQPGLTGPIASATSLEQLDELMGSARLTLTAEDLATLDKASAKDS